MTQPLMPLVEEVAQLLKQTQTRVVFAESCTAGLVSAILARIPGVSEFHCGSAVVYRLDTKTQWLGVPEQMLREVGAVSAAVAQAMAVGVLERTPEADLSAAITGHLGPDAPPDQDGLTFIAMAHRKSSGEMKSIAVLERRLPEQMLELGPNGTESLREYRQWKAAEVVLTLVRDHLIGISTPMTRQT